VGQKKNGDEQDVSHVCDRRPDTPYRSFMIAHQRRGARSACSPQPLVADALAAATLGVPRRPAAGKLYSQVHASPRPRTDTLSMRCSQTGLRAGAMRWGLMTNTPDAERLKQLSAIRISPSLSSRESTVH
jgi:hypothetical protein